MASKLKVEAVWHDELSIIDPDDPVQGGADGVDNIPHVELMQNDMWLKTELAKALERIAALENKGTTTPPLTTGGTTTPNPSTGTPTSATINASPNPPSANGDTTYTVSVPNNWSGTLYLSYFQDNSASALGSVPVPYSKDITVSNGTGSVSFALPYSASTFPDLYLAVSTNSSDGVMTGGSSIIGRQHYSLVAISPVVSPIDTLDKEPIVTTPTPTNTPSLVGKITGHWNYAKNDSCIIFDTNPDNLHTDVFHYKFDGNIGWTDPFTPPTDTVYHAMIVFPDSLKTIPTLTDNSNENAYLFRYNEANKTGYIAFVAADGINRTLDETGGFIINYS